jgi:O-acetyl-ADP-ribose deacetylase (regulator of RNase III)
MGQSRILASFLDGKVQVVTGDITTQNVDAIVNAANSTLLGGGGVDGAIHAKGGPKILEACRDLRRTRFPNGLPTGEAVLTTAGQLPARHVIHTVGPIAASGKEPDASLLAACYRNSLALAADHGLRSIAFPAISTGAYGYPSERAAAVVSETIESVMSAGTPVEQVRLVFFNEDDARTFLKNQTFTTPQKARQKPATSNAPELK